MRDSRYSEFWARLALGAFALCGLLGLRTAGDHVNGVIAQDLVRRTTLVLREHELEPAKPIRPQDNAATIYQGHALNLSRDQRASLMKILDGRPDQLATAQLQSIVSQHRFDFDAIRTASRKPFCHFRPDLTKPYLDEYDAISDAVLVLCARAVVNKQNFRSSQRWLRTAARITAHANQDGFYETLKAYVWSRLYVYKAMDRIGAFDNTANKDLGPEPNIRQSLRGELVHGLSRLNTESVVGKGINWTGGSKTSLIGNQLLGLWGRYYPELPRDGNYDKAQAVLGAMEGEVRTSRFLDRMFLDSYVTLVKLAKEGAELKAKVRGRSLYR